MGKQVHSQLGAYWSSCKGTDKALTLHIFLRHIHRKGMNWVSVGDLFYIIYGTQANWRSKEYNHIRMACRAGQKKFGWRKKYVPQNRGKKAFFQRGEHGRV